MHNINMDALTAAIAQAVAAVLLGQVPAEITTAPVVQAAKPATWAERAKDTRVVRVNANGIGINQYGMFVGKVEDRQRNVARIKAQTLATIRQVLLADGEGWLHCPACTAYWSAAREDAFLERKYKAHLTSARHTGKEVIA